MKHVPVARRADSNRLVGVVLSSCAPRRHMMGFFRRVSLADLTYFIARYHLGRQSPLALSGSFLACPHMVVPPLLICTTDKGDSVIPSRCQVRMGRIG